MTTPSARALAATIAIPRYLQETYWWAYVHPGAIRVFERRWLINLILWGNFNRLRDAALDELGVSVGGRTLQIACVYGDLTTQLAQRIAAGGTLDVADVLPGQLRNLRAKLFDGAPVTLLHMDATDLKMNDAYYDQVLLFFLLHEQPEDVRRATLAEAVRVLKPGGKLVIVDYHRPHPLNLLSYMHRPLLYVLEPFAKDLLRHEITTWLPPLPLAAKIEKQCFFGGMYQKLVLTV